MRRPVVVVLLIPMTFGLCAPGGTPHSNPEPCFAIQAGLDGAAGLEWVNDATKAAQLRESYETVQFFAHLLATALRSGASIESTRQTETDLINAGKAFQARAARLGVQIPSNPLNQYSEYTHRCTRPY